MMPTKLENRNEQGVTVWLSPSGYQYIAASGGIEEKLGQGRVISGFRFLPAEPDRSLGLGGMCQLRGEISPPSTGPIHSGIPPGLLK
jgi:hypothetical protein